ncbi:MAG: hypothetical protein Gyms2KO_23130 [Gymnodinialimonas sp.]
MGISSLVLDVVADVLLDGEPKEASEALRNFDDFVVALSADSGMAKREVESLLVERMLQDPRHRRIKNNVVRLDDYIHLLRAN